MLSGAGSHRHASATELSTALSPNVDESHGGYSHSINPKFTERHETTEVEPGIGLLPQLSAGGILVAAGFHAHATNQVDRHRAAVDAQRTGAQLVKVVEKLADEGYLIGGDKLKTKPRGYDADLPRIELCGTSR
jgi:Conserved hypothetical protein (DUF2461)